MSLSTAPSKQAAPVKEFNRLRAALWPVHRYELKKLVPLLLIFFLISFDYNVLRIMKDTLVVTAKQSGAEVIPFIKVWVMFPGALVLTYLFTKLSNRLNRDTVFYVILGIFLGYFALFITVLYPWRDTLHPHAFADYLQAVLPPGFKGMVAMFRNWTFTSFYVMAELWSNIIFSMVFWGFANQVTRLSEAKRFYGLFGIGANFSGVVAGNACIFLSVKDPEMWGQTMGTLLSLVLLAGGLAMGIFWWFNKVILKDERFYDASVDQKEGNVKGKLSMRESFAYLFRSKYMICIALVVISYNLVINLVEVVWKNQMHELYPDSGAYNLYTSYVATITGVLATLAALFISGNSIRKCGWTFTAMLTPAILLITSIGFFGFIFAKGEMNDVIEGLFGVGPLVFVVFFGSAQNILSRSAKYTVFDATKEMAFIPLSREEQLKGKPMVDGVCSRLGKSGGSVIHQMLLMSFASFAASAPYVAGFSIAVITGWLFAVRALGKRFKAITADQPLPAAPVVEEEQAPAQPALAST